MREQNIVCAFLGLPFWTDGSADGNGSRRVIVRALIYKRNQSRRRGKKRQLVCGLGLRI